MKKLIIFVLTLFLTFTIFLSSKSANAELTPITPFYEGDILSGQEIYLFQNYSATPNFENGYISKKTISLQDIYYQENSYFNGWYKNLGLDLLEDYTAPEHEPQNPVFYFYIKFNNLLGQYMQLALHSLEPYEAEYIIKYSDGTTTTLTATGGNEYLLTTPQNETTKEVIWLCYDVYYPDYIASFRPLTAQLAYDFGFTSGQSEGYTTGHNVGYNTGYSNGYNQGLVDASEPNYVAVQVYNQLIDYDKFRGGTSGGPGYTYKSNNNGTITLTITENITEDRALNFFMNDESSAIMVATGHKYYYYLSDNNNIVFRNAYIAQTFSNEGVNTQPSYANNYIWFFMVLKSGLTTGTYTLKPQLIDLTIMYGTGNEPTLQQCKEIFTSYYYPYNTGSVLNLNYIDGYNEGMAVGYEKGKDAQATQQLTSTGWMSSIFGGISSLLNIQIFPGVTIGIIVGIPFIISLAYFVIRAFRGGGSD